MCYTDNIFHDSLANSFFSLFLCFSRGFSLSRESDD